MRLFVSLVILFLLSTPSWATTYYVRTDGGTATQCTGTTDAAYPGSGTGVACAFSHPVWALGGPSASVLMQSGDTLIIDDIDQLVGSGQAKYMIGYGMANSTCNNTSSPYNCYLNSIPAGIDSAHTTKVYGKKWNSGCSAKPQLWGTQGTSRIITLGGDYIDVRCLELTDHSACLFRGPLGADVDGDSLSCPEVYPTTIHYARYGFLSTSSIHHLTMKNIYAHGLYYAGQLGTGFGVCTSGSVGDINIIDSDFTGNSLTGFQTNPPTYGDGTLRFINDRILFSGCGEHYPLINSDIRDGSNYHHCYDQNQGGNGDGLAFGRDQGSCPSGASSAGDWIIQGGEYSFNTQDGIDFLHGDGTGTLKLSRVKLEGNAGQAIKTVGQLSYIENSMISGNCQFFEGQTFTSTTSVNYSESNCTSNGGSWDAVNGWCNYSFGGSCRANGTLIKVRLKAGNAFYAYSNTMNAGGSNIIYELDGTSNTCDGTSIVKTRNNIYIGGYSWLDDTYHNVAGGNALSTIKYNDGGSTGGTCDSITLDGDYESSDGNFKASDLGCYGAHSLCAQNPLVVGPITNGHGSLGSYYQGTNYTSRLYLSSSSPLRSAATSSISYQDGSLDFNYNSRPPYDIGGVIYNSTSVCRPDTYICSTGSDCCSGHCSDNNLCYTPGSYLYNITPIGSIKFQ